MKKNSEEQVASMGRSELETCGPLKMCGLKLIRQRCVGDRGKLQINMARQLATGLKANAVTVLSCMS